MHMLDLAAYTGPLLVVALLVIFAVFVSLRDPEHAAPRLVSRAVWCPRHKHLTMVEFNELIELAQLVEPLSLGFSLVREKSHGFCGPRIERHGSRDRQQHQPDPSASAPASAWLPR